MAATDVMATAHLSADQAFAVLKAQSQHTNTKLRDVAADLVAAQQRKLGAARASRSVPGRCRSGVG